MFKLVAGAQQMEQVTYCGFATGNEYRGKHHTDMFPRIRQKCHIVSDLLYISDNQIIKFEDERFILLLDGIIYEYNNKVFTEKCYSKLASRMTDSPYLELCRLDGEFTLIFVNKIQRSVLFANSETGKSALFYHLQGNSISFSNSLTELKTVLEDDVDINLIRLYNILQGDHLGSENTVYGNIKKLMPGHAISINRKGTHQFEYTDLFTIQAKNGSVTENHYEEFRSLFANAIQKRISSKKIGVALSSGLDSTAIAAMANRIRKYEQKLLCYTYKPGYLPEVKYNSHPYNETVLLYSFFKKYPGIDWNHIEVPGYGLLDSLKKSLDLYEIPVYGASNQFWIQEMHRMAHADGCRTLLIGQGGNYTISWPPLEIVQYQKGRIKRWLKKIASASHEQKGLSYLSGAFAHSIKKHYTDEDVCKPDLIKDQQIYLRNSIHYVGSIQKLVSLKSGIHITDPTVDKDLVRFCMKLPDKAYHDKDHSRKLVTVGMKGYIPDTILENQVRGIQSSDIHYRIHNERDAFYKELKLLNNHKLVKFVFNLDHLLKDWEHFDFPKMKRKEINYILRVFLVSMFLSQSET